MPNTDTRPAPGSYAEQWARLQAASEQGALEVTLDLDPGSSRMTLRDAFETWEVLSPGEAFQITDIHFTTKEV